MSNDAVEPSRVVIIGIDGAVVASNESITDLRGVLGGRVRILRKRRNMTLAKLADGAGLSTGYISQIERGLVCPSIPALTNIARSLAVSIDWFFVANDQAPAEELGYVVRRKTRLRMPEDAGLTEEILTERSGLGLQMIYSTLAPGSEDTAGRTFSGDCVGYVLSGQLGIWIGEHHFTLDEGDSCSWESGEYRRLHNPGPHGTTVLWVTRSGL